MTKHTPVRVDCLQYYRPETVYIRNTTYDGETIADFYGCEFCDFNSAKCEMCRKAAQALFQAEHPELPSIHSSKP